MQPKCHGRITILEVYVHIGIGFSISNIGSSLGDIEHFTVLPTLILLIMVHMRSHTRTYTFQKRVAVLSTTVIKA
jgi:hypothetical protein